jgi:hypothetical protein
MTGNGFQQMLLAGYSSGVPTAYTLLNQETQLPPGQRNVRGFLSVDGFFKTGIESERQESCAFAQAEQDLLDAGIYEDQTPTVFLTVGALADLNPSGDSPFFPGLTNMQFALLAGAATFQISGTACCFHFVGGAFGTSGLPEDLLYTDVPVFLDFLQTAGFYMPVRFVQERDAVACEEEDLPYDDHLARITVPILEITAGGGFAGVSDMASRVASRDFSEIEVRLLSPDLELVDIGHTDIWTANDAPSLFWAPMLDWIDNHCPGGVGLGPPRGDAISD